MALDKGLSQEAELRLKLTNDDPRQITRALEELIDTLERAGKSTEMYDRLLNNISKGQAGVAKAQRQAAAAVKASSAAQNEAANAAKKQLDHLPRLRYALYDVASSATFAGAAMLGLSVATAGVAINMDRRFADVVRTTGTYVDRTGQSTERLRQQFEQLFASMPTSWADLTEIGTLAGQLNVASANVAEFTRLVTMFAATTDVSVEAAATAFGRLAELLDVPADKYENLGSSILAVGVNSVATESQIINTSKELASIGATAGFSADEVFGLSAALASLGTQPELSRGVITRTFTRIATAVGQGGVALDNFGRLAGTTGKDFAKAWGQDAAGAFTQLMAGLGSLDQSGAVAVLKELGITASRDVPTLLRLAQNSDVLAKSLKVAADGFEDGTALQEQYSIISSTVAEKINILVNNFQLLVKATGEAAGGLGFIIDGIIGLTRVFTAIASNPVASTLAGITLTVTALGGVLLLIVGQAARSAASIFALRTAMDEMGISSMKSGLSVQSLTAALFGQQIATGKAAIATRALSVAMKGLWVASAVTVAVPVIDWLNDIALEARNATVGTEDIAKAIQGISGDKAKQSLNEINEAIAALGRTTAGAGPIASTGDFAIAKMVREGVSQADAELQAGLARLSQKTSSWFANPSNYGLGFLGGESGLAPWASMVDPGIDEIQKFVDAYIQAWDAAATATEQKAVLDQYEELKKASIAAAVEMGVSADQAASDWEHNWGRFIVATEGGVDALKLAGEQARLTAEEIKATLDSVTVVVDATLATQNALYSLGEALGENGNAWSEYSEAGRGNMAALLAVIDAVAAETPGDAATIASNLQALFEMLVAGGHASAQQLLFLKDVINGLSDGSEVKAARVDFSSLWAGIQSGAEKASKEIKKVKEEVRTLADVARDAGSVMQRAFDIRFGPQIGLDAIASGWNRIKEETEDARQAILDHQRTLSGLKADKATLEYWLSVAVMYGDDARASQIRAQLGEVNGKIADENKAIKEEQDKVNKSLTGNTDAAIENRAALYGLLGDYQSYISALIASGAPQSEVNAAIADAKQRFYDQATAMGFSRDELGKYGSAFDDMSQIVEKIPRDVTVKFNADPALQALNEFVARFRDAGEEARDNFESGFDAGPKYTIGVGSGGGRAAKFYASGGYTGAGSKFKPAGIVHADEYVMPKRVVRNLGVATLARIHRLGMRGRGYANGGLVGGAMPRIGSQGPITGVVGLDAMTIQAIALAVRPMLFLDGKQVADNSSAHYANSTALGSA